MKRILAGLWVLTFFSFFVTAQNSTDPPPRVEDAPYGVAWLEYEAAETAVEDRDYSEALRRYARALELNPGYAEAYVGLARTYRFLGDTNVAERYYKEALQRISQLQIPADAYAIRLELAEMYDVLRGTGDNDRKYRNELLHVIEADPVFSQDDPPGQRRAMRELLFRDGINRVIVLYRVGFPEALKAHRLYGRYLLEQPSPSIATRAAEHFLFVVVEIAGRGVDAIIERQHDYQFSSLGDLSATAARYPAILAYLRSEDLIGVLRNLSRALEVVTDPDATVAIQSVRAEIEAVRSVLDR